MSANGGQGRNTQAMGSPSYLVGVGASPAGEEA